MSPNTETPAVCPRNNRGILANKRTVKLARAIIPALAWNLYYNSDERVKQMPKPIALGLQVPTVKVMNWVFILIILVLGLGMGGWASIKTMDEKVKEFELFDRCNGC